MKNLPTSSDIPLSLQKQILQELIVLHNIKDVTYGFNLNRMFDYSRMIVYISVVLTAIDVCVLRAIELFMRRWGGLNPDIMPEELNTIFLYSTVLIFFISLVYMDAIYFRIMRALRDLHPKWEIYNSHLYLYYFGEVFITGFFVWLSASAEFSNPDTRYVFESFWGTRFIPYLHQNKDVGYVICALVRFLFLAGVVFYANNKANKMYINMPSLKSILFKYNANEQMCETQSR